MAPVPPPYDPVAWDAQPFPTKLRMVCEAWALGGYGTPVAVFAVYGLKVLVYVAGWLLFCCTTDGYALTDVASWWLTPVAFQKAIAWSMLFEVLGLGCGSGPLTGRYFPPVGGALYFLRPGTTKRPLFPSLPLIGGDRRTALDVALYAALCGALLYTLTAGSIDAWTFAPVVVLLPLVTIGDKTLFLTARGEHYWVTALCFVLAGDWIGGAKCVQLALWFWAGVSKLNHHFPAVVCVMTSNSPVLRSRWLRRRMYRGYPDDLRPSRLAVAMSYFGTFLELGVPVVLLLGSGGTVTTVGLIMMLMLHGFITSNVPMGVPIEWNVMVVYGAFFLFGEHAAHSAFAIGSLPLAAVLAVMLVAVPLLGNFFPERVSFLLAMRYYAGNWAYSVWLFRDESFRKLDEHLVKSSPWVMDQLSRFYDEGTAVGLVGKVMAFRAMHLHGRALRRLVPELVDDISEYTWVDGEIVAGLVLGWNFGDGHLHDERLLASVQRQCGYAPGELRCLFVESQPLFGDRMTYRLADAHDGVIETGELDVKQLRAWQPWPDPWVPTPSPTAVAASSEAAP